MSDLLRIREALECAEYALTHPASDTDFALNAVRDTLRALAPPPAPTRFAIYRDDADRICQWFNAVADLNPKYLEQADYEMAGALARICGRKPPAAPPPDRNQQEDNKPRS